MSQITATVTPASKASNCMVAFSFDSSNTALIALLSAKEIDTEAGLNVSQRSITVNPKEAETLISDFVEQGFLGTADAAKIRADIAKKQSLSGLRGDAEGARKKDSPVVG